MARLRVRIKLNRDGVAVPLHKLAAVVGEVQKFLQLLAEDVRIDQDNGEWLGFDFDHESLTFTTEYIGPVTAEQARAFYAAFNGTTPLRRGTIAQFVRIADAIEEDELIGFGLYQSEEEAEPAEWRGLSRRDALRIADEIQLLLAPSSEFGQPAHLPAAIDSNAVARIFAGHSDPSVIQGKWVASVRELESTLSNRIALVENQVGEHSGSIHLLRSELAATEESVRNLLSALEAFCDQATRRLERTSPPSAPPPTNPKGRPILTRPALALAASLGVAIISSGLLLWPARDGAPRGQPVRQKMASSPASPQPVAFPPAPPVLRVEREASAKGTPPRTRVEVESRVPKGQVDSLRPPAPRAPPEAEPEPEAAPSPPVVTAEDLRKVVSGMNREEVLKLGPPASRVTMFEGGRLLEVYRYTARNTLIGVVKLTDGSVSSVQVP